MSYKIRSYDANHGTYVNYNIGSVKYSEIMAITGGNRTDAAGHNWAFSVPYSYNYGRKITANISGSLSLETFLNNCASVGLGSLDVAADFMTLFPANNDNYYLQKNPTTTKEYPNITYNNSSSGSGVIYTNRVLWPMQNANTPNTMAVSITARSDDPQYNVTHVLSPLLVVDNNNEPLYLGAFGITLSPNYNFANLQIVVNTACSYEYFSPILTVVNNNQPLEGDYSYNFTGDDIELPTAPDETVSGVLASGFLNIYKPTDGDLRAFGGALWTNAFNTKWYDLDSVANLILNAVSNPIDFIIGLFMLPITPDTGNASGIYLGGINVNTITAPRVTVQYKTIDFGIINIEELYGNYLDYANSRVSIYLPYVGTADIDVQEINGGSVHLQYIVDCFTGACVANVQCVKQTKTPWGQTYLNKTVHSYSGNMAIQLPISAGSFDTLTQGLINVGLGLGTNTPAVAMTGAKDVMQGFAGDVTTRGSLSSNTGKLGYQTPYLMFTKPIESRPANLGELHGYSAGVGGVLSQFKGYVECSDVKLDGVTATDNELNEIESILKSGVYV